MARSSSIICLLVGLLAGGGVFAQPAEVSRVLKTIDFEERRLGNPEELPMYWVKQEGANLPHYVNGKLAADRARGGKYAFRFELNGGGLIYRYDPRQVRVRLGAHYRVQTFVQTTILPKARARLTAYLMDIDQRPIAQTIVHSPLYAATAEREGWKELSVELSADDERAAYLAVELELLQPAQYAPATLGQRTLLTQDINGVAWFDDLTIAQVPKVSLTTDRPGNLFAKGETRRLTVQVSDRFTEDLAAQLVVTDADGKIVYQRSGALEMASARDIGPGHKKLWLDIPAELKPGWYEAALVMSSHGQYVGRQTLDLILLADDGRLVRPDGRFGLIATDLPFAGWSELPQILPLLSAGRVKLAVWSAQGNVQQADEADFDTLLERLAENEITPTACLLELPPAIAKKVGASDWTALLKADKETWQPQLAYLIARHANHLDRWQLGPDGGEAFVTQKGMRDVYSLIFGEFAKLVRKPDLAMPWPAWYEMDGNLPATVALSIPTSVLPSQIPLYMADLKQRQGHNLSLSLQLLDRSRYGRMTQIRDLAQRIVYALSADARRIDLPLPFTVESDDGRTVKQPQELLMVMRTLLTHLSGSQYCGKVPVAEGVEAFLFDKNGKGVLVLWDRGSDTAVKQLALSAGDNPVRVDLWGNATALVEGPDKRERSAALTMDIGPMPVLLIDIDGGQAQLRASVALDRPLLESSLQPHARKLRFTNAYKTAIAGTCRLEGPAGWTITPPSVPFNLNPGETLEKDLTIRVPYSSVAGIKTIRCEFTVQADQSARFMVPLSVNLGLSDVGMQTLALRDGKDVIVHQVISNYGDKPIDYSAFAIFPGQARQERLVINLAPGKSTIKRFKFTDVTITGDTKVRVGVKQLEGTRVLNDEVGVQ